ncbi:MULTISPECIES: uroporphyrinogen-III synthase [unclassified Brevundimonas]|uniref:uroporphyrinogen-III synthase n=1 Tax=unclassified Brevundimonas TaxID=2622653 RepID=UPI000E9FF547|nr:MULTISPECIES: uroporphyrinogen-III synthase [unclassified Brevundimonas]MCK6104282.1 uroporphyrinogen-III synthase [Brevundimonas sp. EYE_349]HBI18718.1 uroporphyrinogen-III synthase [Brevundimonas sp.]
MTGAAPLRVWITRAEPGASRTAARLRDMGLEPIIASLLAVEPLTPVLPDLATFNALAFTSPNGVAAFAALTPRRDHPVFAVGDATAQAASAVGFPDVRSAQGDLAALARLIAESLSEAAILIPQAETPAGDMTAALTRAGARGVTAHLLSTYRTNPTTQPAPPAFDAVLIHSPRAAKLLGDRHAGRLNDVEVACISPAAAAPLAALGLHPLIATDPNEAALLAILNPTLGKRGRAV